MRCGPGAHLQHREAFRRPLPPHLLLHEAAPRSVAPAQRTESGKFSQYRARINKTPKLITSQIISQRRHQLAAENTCQQGQPINKPFLDVLLTAKLDGKVLKEREIIEEVSTFIFTVRST